MFCSNIVVPLFALCLHRFNPRMFSTWYAWTALASEVLVIVHKSYGTPCKETGSLGILSILAIYSPLSPLMILGVPFHTAFWQQTVIQFVRLVVSQLWIYSLCHQQHSVIMLGELGNGFLWHLESSISTIFLVRLRRGRPVYPCRVSVGFFHLTAGFVLPCALQYVLESYQRAKYLANRISSGSKDVAWSLFLGNLELALKVSMFCVMGSWALVSWYLSLDQSGQCAAEAVQ